MGKRKREPAEMRVLLVGRTGTGKSSLGNVLLGKDVFAVGGPMESTTKACQVEYNDEMEVMDTPGLFSRGWEKSEQEMRSEFKRAHEFIHQGSSVVLLVLRSDRRFTKREKQAYLDLKELLGDDISCRMVVVFNRLDSRGKTLDDQLRSLDEDLLNPPLLMEPLLRDVANRYCGFNCEATGGEKRNFRKRLVSMMDRVCYSREDPYMVEKDVQVLKIHPPKERPCPNKDAAMDSVDDILQMLLTYLKRSVIIAIGMAAIALKKFWHFIFDNKTESGVSHHLHRE